MYIIIAVISTFNFLFEYTLHIIYFCSENNRADKISALTVSKLIKPPYFNFNYTFLFSFSVAQLLPRFTCKMSTFYSSVSLSFWLENVHLSSYGNTLNVCRLNIINKRVVVYNTPVMIRIQFFWLNTKLIERSKSYHCLICKTLVYLLLMFVFWIIIFFTIH